MPRPWGTLTGRVVSARTTCNGQEQAATRTGGGGEDAPPIRLFFSFVSSLLLGSFFFFSHYPSSSSILLPFFLLCHILHVPCYVLLCSKIGEPLSCGTRACPRSANRLSAGWVSKMQLCSFLSVLFCGLAPPHGHEMCRGAAYPVYLIFIFLFFYRTDRQCTKTTQDEGGVKSQILELRVIAPASDGQTVQPCFWLGVRYVCLLVRYEYECDTNKRSPARVFVQDRE